MTISLLGNLKTSYQSAKAGNYIESAIVNGHPSWINANHAIWFVDDLDDWAVGDIKERGTIFRGLSSHNQGGSVCPFDITSTNWDFWNGTKWNSVGGGAGEIAFSCSPVECKNNNHINMYKGLTMIWIVKLCPKNISKLAFYGRNI